jgi:hypothetical protein
MGSQQLWNWGLRRYMMTQMFMRAILMTCVSILITNIASAQEAETIGLGDVFTWARTTPPDWGRGALFAILGLFGALVTIFGLIGGAVPGTAGQAKIDKDNNLLEEWLQELNKVIRGSAPNKAVEIAAIEKVVDNYRDDIRAERWHQFWLAAVLYALLGAFSLPAWPRTYYKRWRWQQDGLLSSAQWGCGTIMRSVRLSRMTS